MAAIRLIATDLDGTLIARPAEEFHLYQDFRRQINEARRRFNCVWAICTSREMSSFRRFFAHMAAMEVKPDFVIVKHAYIHRLTRWGFYVPHIRWNLRIAYVQWLNRLDIHTAIHRWHRQMLLFLPGTKTVRKTRDRLWMRFTSEEALGRAVQQLEAEVREFRLLKIFRYRTEMDIRTIPFTKGLAVMELASHLGIGREEVMAIGNGHNDTSMLDGTVAAMTGCPLNSEPEVMQEVNRSGGHIAGQSSLAGTMEIIDAHINGCVQSQLPASWKDPATIDPGEEFPRRSHHSEHRLRPGGLLLIGAVVYAVLLSFATFDLIPLSGMIRKPYDIAIRITGKIVRVFLK